MSTIFTDIKNTIRRHRRRLSANGQFRSVLNRLQNRSHSHIGRWGERVARTILQRAGASIIKVNWRATDGEADIVAIERRRLLIIEVKTRHYTLKDTYPALAAVDTDKRTRLRKLAHAFMRNNGPLCRRLAVKTRRIDAVEVYYRRTWFGFPRVDTVSWHKGIEPSEMTRA